MLRAFALNTAGTGAAGLESTAVAELEVGRPVAEPRPAATVILLRDSAVGPEVFLLRRTASMAFAPRMHVFPGGGVDPRDADSDLPWAGPPPAQWALALGCSEPYAAALVCAAVRELFEECGVLLAGEDAVAAEAAQRESDRQQVLDRSVALSELLRRRGLLLRSDLLRPWAHWTTPELEPRRYDTRFFVAALPSGEQARDVGGEADRAAWIGAAAAVRGHAEGRLAMLPPTLICLEEVAGHRDVASVLAAPRRLRRVMPWVDGDLLVVDVDGVGGGEPGPGQPAGRREP